MHPRLEKELTQLTRIYPELQFEAAGLWLFIPKYSMPAGWNRPQTDVSVQVPAGYPITPPYGIYVPVGIQYAGSTPNNYQEPASNQPPFNGPWGVFSWSPQDGDWLVSNADILGRANLQTYVRGIRRRFEEGL